MSALDPGLVRALAAIGPYLDQVVLAGGWVTHVYELLYDETGAGRSPRTRDVDLAIHRSIPVRDDGSIHQLLAAAGFECRFHSLDSPPVTKYFAAGEVDEVEIEFITDAPGSSEAVVKVQPDLTVQELHYVGLLLGDPWEIDLATLTGSALDLILRIPKPGAFVFHKSLVSASRADRVKREKDLYYVFFVLDSFPRWRSTIETQLASLASERPAWFKKSLRNMTSLFDEPEGPGSHALLDQRPRTAYVELNDDQFRQHAFGVMTGLIAMMRRATGRLDEGEE